MASCVATFIWFLGAHEPLYFGWQAFLIFGTLSMLIILLTALYISYVLAIAQYAAVNMSKKLPKNMPMMYKTTAWVSIILNLAAVVTTIVTKDNRANAIRHAASLIIVSFAAPYAEISFLRLRKVLQAIHGSLSHSIADSSRPASLSRIKPNDASSHNTLPSPLEPIPPSLEGDKSSQPSLTNLQTMPSPKREVSCRDLHADSKANLTGQNHSQIRTTKSDSKLGGYHLSHKITSSSTHLSGKNKEAKKKSTKIRRARAVVKRINIYIRFIPIIGTVIFLCLLANAVTQILYGGNYDEEVANESQTYNLLTDISQYLTIVAIQCCQYYAMVRAPEPIQNFLDRFFGFECCRDEDE
ncbi:hypothetical protein AAMO2058_001031100 [Amorphochlora amoebiformis]